MKLTALLLLVAPAALGQSPTIRQVGLGAGVSGVAVRNAGASQLLQRGAAFPVQGYYLRQGHRHRDYVQLQFASYGNELTSAYGGTFTTLTTGHLQYAYHRRVREWGAWTGWAGGVLSLQGANTGFGANQFGTRYLNTEAPTLLSTLSASVLLSRTLGRSRLEGRFWLNALSYNIRPGYAYAYPEVNSFGQFVRAGRWETPPNFKHANLRLSYAAPLAAHWWLRLDYQGQFWSVRRPRYTGTLTNQGVVSGTYEF